MYPVVKIAGMAVPGFSLMMLAGFYVPLFMIIPRAYEHGLTPRKILKALIAAGPFVVTGGKFLSFLSVAGQGFSPRDYIPGGFVFYGGLLGFFAGLWVYTRYTDQSFLKYADFLSPYIALGQSFGRVGCLLNGCCYGAASDLFFAVRYPQTHPTHGVPVLPVPVMESAGCLLLSWFLFHRKPRRFGNFTVYMAAYPAMRFTLEYLRGDAIRGIYGPFSTSQWVGVGIYLFLSARFLLCKKSDSTGSTNCRISI